MRNVLPELKKKQHKQSITWANHFKKYIHIYYLFVDSALIITCILACSMLIIYSMGI